MIFFSRILKSLCVSCCFFSFVLANQDVLKINNKVYSEKMFYSLFPKTDWDELSKKQKRGLLSEYINKKTIFLKSEEDGYLENPHFRTRLSSRINQFLVNVSYDLFVVLPLVDSSLFEETRKNLKREINVDHLLVGYKNCRLPLSFKRSKEESKDLAFSFFHNLKTGSSFSDLVVSFSDDPSVNKNKGNLGWISWGRTVPVFQNAAFLLSQNEFSSPVLTDFGYHIILCKDVRPSSFSFLDSLDYNAKCIESSLASVPLNVKKEAAKNYDNNILTHSAVVFNYKTLNFLFDYIISSNLKNKIVSSGKRNFINILQEVEESGVVCVYNGKGFGLRWFLNHLASFPSSRVPALSTVEDLKNLFNTIILQKHALTKINSHFDDFSTILNLEIKDIKENLVYDSYLKNYINNIEAPLPDSVSLYYNKNISSLYTNFDLVSVREIKTLSSSLSDSLYTLLLSGSSFIDIASSFSLTNPNNGGLVPPFALGQYGPMGKRAFQLEVGSFSKPFSNLDNTWSILFLEEKFDSLVVPLEKVYSKIENLLLKDHQKNSKNLFLEQLNQKYSVWINESFFEFEL